MRKNIYSEVYGNKVTTIFDGTDYEVQLNDMTIFSTGDENECELIAESADIILSILRSQNKLK